MISRSPYTTRSFATGQVAQLVERGPEKAGVGGSIPSLATNNFNHFGILIYRTHNTRTAARSDSLRAVVKDEAASQALQSIKVEKGSHTTNTGDEVFELENLVLGEGP